MRRFVDRIADRFRPKILRSNHPDRTFFTRQRHWLLEETRFLLLTRRGPVELVIRPAYVAAAAFVGFVGISVIAGTTLFVGYNAVEVVSKDTISTAEASIPIVEPADIEAEFDLLAQRQLALSDASPDETVTLSLPAKAPKKMIDDRFGSSADQQSEEIITQFAALAGPQKSKIPSGILGDSMAEPGAPTASVNDALSPFAPTIESDEPAVGERSFSPAKTLLAMLKSPFTSQSDDAPFNQNRIGQNRIGQSRISQSRVSQLKPPTFFHGDPDGDESQIDDKTEIIPAPAGAVMIRLSPPVVDMVPYAPDSKIPVLTTAVRQQKLLRSMVREVNAIRDNLVGLGIEATYLPQKLDWQDKIEAADIAGLMMSLEAHRSALRKVPLKPPMLYFYISSNYGKRKHPVTGKVRMHHGIDLAGTWQENVRASAPGTVVFAGKMGSFGNVVRIQHDFGITTTYAHLARITTKKGADIMPGTVIGKMGQTGRVDGAHLHYEIRVGRKSLDPQDFFDIGHRIGVGGELMQAAAVN